MPLAEAEQAIVSAARFIDMVATLLASDAP